MDVSTALKQLKEPAMVTFQSSPHLAGQVERKAKKLDQERVDREQLPQVRKRQLVPVAEARHLDGMSISSWEILHILARATVLASQGSSRALAQHWECLRYVTALQTNGQHRMELSSDGKDPRYHRKAVQAQDLGTAFGLAAAQRIMQERHPDYRFDIVDAEVALEAGWALRGSGSSAREHTKLRPNYFLVGWKPGAPLRIASVDCKGSHGTVEVQHEQLAKSAARVQTIVLDKPDADGAPPPSLLMATGVAAKGGIEARILDPEGDGVLSVPEKIAPDLTGPVDELNLFPLVSYTNDAGERDSRPGFSLPTERREWFSRVLTRTNAAALLTFAGDRNAAQSLLTQRQQYRLGATHSHASPGMRCDTGITLAGLPLVGTDHVFRLNGKRMEVFSGVTEEMYRLLVDHKLDDYEIMLPDVLANWKQRKAKAEKEWGGVLHVDRSGTLMAIRAQGSKRKQLD